MVSRLDIKKKSTTTPLRKAEDTKQELNTFDISKVKSSVSNPSTKYKWISVDDEIKIDNIVSQKLPNWTPWQISDMTQWLYSVALNEQKKKDVQAGRDKVIMELEYLASNSNWRQKSEYNTQIKRAKLADLIREINGKIPLEMTDNAIIKKTLEKYPEYNDEFLKFYYDNRSKDDLAKDLWWKEETGWEKFWGKVWDIAEWFAWWMPKFWESVKDFADLALAWSDQNRTKEQNIQDVAFWNYVQDKYWTYPWNLTQQDYWQAMKDFSSSKNNKNEYTPNLASATTKWIEWLTDIAITSTAPWALIKLWFSIAWNVPYAEDAVWAIGRWVSEFGNLVNKIPWLSDIRNSLPTEEEKKDFDMLAWGWAISRIIKWTKAVKNKKYITKDTLNEALNEIKRWWEEALKDLSKWLDVDSFSNAFYDIWAWRKLAWQKVSWDILNAKKQELQL